MTYTVRDRAERIQADAWADMYAAAPAEFATATGLRVADLGGGARQFFLPAAPYRMFNRALGLGVEAPATEAQIERALDDDPGVTISLAPGARPDALPAWLAARGLRVTDEWAVLVRDAAPPAPAPTDLTVVDADPERFGQVLVRGYETPDALGQWVAALVGRPGWRTLLARDGDTPVGCAAVRIADGGAWFGPAATLPAARGRGAQSALFARRIALCIDAGCELLVTEALPDTPETPNPSYRNMIRAGFVESYRHANYRKESP